jgi:hypothetical protein
MENVVYLSVVGYGVFVVCAGVFSSAMSLIGGTVSVKAEYIG